MSDHYDVTGEHDYSDGHGGDVDQFSHSDGSTTSFVHGADGSDYEVDTDAYGNSHVEGVDGSGDVISGDVDSHGNVTDVHGDMANGDHVSASENYDGSYNVSGESGGHHYYESGVDLDRQ